MFLHVVKIRRAFARNQGNVVEIGIVFRIIDSAVFQQINGKNRHAVRNGNARIRAIGRLVIRSDSQPRAEADTRRLVETHRRAHHGKSIVDDRFFCDGKTVCAAIAPHAIAPASNAVHNILFLRNFMT